MAELQFVCSRYYLLVKSRLRDSCSRGREIPRNQELLRIGAWSGYGPRNEVSNIAIIVDILQETRTLPRMPEVYLFQGIQ